jgi:hypothetical protein
MTSTLRLNNLIVAVRNLTVEALKLTREVLYLDNPTSEP